MSTIAITSIIIGWIIALAMHCVLWFAAYKAGLLVVALLLSFAAALLVGIGMYVGFRKIKNDANVSLSTTMASDFIDRMKNRRAGDATA